MNSCRIDDVKGYPVYTDLLYKGISRSPCYFRNDRSFFPKQHIQKRRFSDIRFSEDRGFDPFGNDLPVMIGID